MWMIKSKFGGYVRSKTQTAMANEVYCKVLCHISVVSFSADSDEFAAVPG